MTHRWVGTGIALVVLVLSLFVFSTTLVHALWYAPDGSEAPAALAAAPIRAATSSIPVRLIIPALDINANVQKTTMSDAGNMGVPTNFTDVAWYAPGTVPGQIGSAVIDGHVDNGLGLDGVFKHLDSIKAGDEIDVVDKDGQTLKFIVRDIELYPYQSVPDDLVFNQDDTARLNLITCDGTWVPGGRTYDHRLVVFATLE